MILRLKEIKQVGSFKSFSNGGAVAISNLDDNNKISVVLGNNTYGKSTLADVLRSVNDNDPSPIIKRKTIPATPNSTQTVNISYKKTSTDSEQAIEYRAGVWTNNVLQGKMLVFDQEFIQKNVFTGLELTHDNKKNFTDFILGEEGTKLGEEIEKRKIATQKFPEELRNTCPEAVKGTPEEVKVDEFVRMEVAETEEALRKAVDDHEKTLVRLNKTSDFSGLPLFTINKESYKAVLDEFNALLTQVKSSSYDDVSKEAMEQIQRTDSGWLEQGTKLIVGEECPYCTQDIAPVSDLIKAYQAVFDEKYDKYTSSVNGNIDSLNSALNTLSTTHMSGTFSKNIELAKKYLPYIGELKEAVEKLDVQLEKLQTAESEVRKCISEQTREATNGFASNKRTNIHRQCEADVPTEQLEVAVIDADKEADVLREALNKCEVIIQNKRTEVERWTPDVIEENIRETKKAISTATTKIHRLQQDGQCKTYTAKRQQQVDYRNETKRLQEQLQTEQSDYLKNLFSSIGDWFKNLGSNDFKLDRKTSNRGNKTVYELEVSFCGQPINSEDLSKIFSESDRRNLALAIYLARAEQLDKPNTILVLDDPVVSFDDNRIRTTCVKLKELSDEFEQIIILTHYKTVVQQLLKLRAKAIYVKLVKDTSGAKLVSFNTNDFNLSDHEKAYLVLDKFANGASDYRGEPRPFLESHINLLFQPNLNELNLTGSMLSEKINGLKTGGVITEEQYAKLDKYRDAWNPDHHDVGDSTSIEDSRNLTRQMLEDLYSL